MVLVVSMLWLRAIILEAGGAQTPNPMPLDEPFPRLELFPGNIIALAGLLEAEQAVTHRGDDLGLAPHDPTNRVAGR